MATSTELLSSFSPEKKHVDPYISRALAASPTKMLTLHEFVQVTDYPINKVMLDYFWQVFLSENESIHVGKDLMEFFGYSGETRKSKEVFLRLMDRNNIQYKTVRHTDPEVERFPTILEEINSLPNIGAAALSNWIVMSSRDVKKAILKLNTKEGDLIREYYIDLEMLAKKYVGYQLDYRSIEAQHKISSLEEMMNSMRVSAERQEQKIDELLSNNRELLSKNDELLERSVDAEERGAQLQDTLDVVHNRLQRVLPERAVPPDTPALRDRFVITRRVDRYGVKTLYAVRGQHKHVDAKLAGFRQDYHAVEVLLDYACSPNSVGLFNRAKETLKREQGVRFYYNLVRLPVGMTEARFVALMREVDESRIRDLLEESPPM
ncbi:MAG TPA: DUF3627 domain-containing protein [Nitrospiraceae bacterium]|nr:DUF3627 domain-containing protein [Nitrospiraceae bacterium]